MARERSGNAWVPPPWHAPSASNEGGEPSGVARGRRSTPRRPPPHASDTSRYLVLSLAIAPALTGVFSLLFAVVAAVNGPMGLPVGLVALSALQGIGLITARYLNAIVLAKSLLICLIVTVGALPAVGLQSSLLHEPYVSLSRGSATPLIIATFGVLVLIVVTAMWCVLTSWSMPADVSLLFAPLALLVPSVLGLRGTIDHRAALEALAESALFAAGLIVLAWSLSLAARPLLPPVAFVAQVALLWIAGRGPSFASSSGAIVSLVYAVTIGVTGMMVVALPFTAAWLRRAFEALEEQDGPRRSQTSGGHPS